MISPRSPHETARLPRNTGWRTLLAALVLWAGACTEGQSMTPLDSSKYFSDAATARFVDDVQRGNSAGVRSALAAGQDPNAKGAVDIRPIHFAFAARTAEVLALLLGAGADPNAKAPNGNRPLHYAVQQRTPDFTQVLLQYKADPRLPGEGDQPVLYLALSSPVAAAILPPLIAAGADVNHRWGGYPPLQAAMVQQDWGSAYILLKSGADPTRQTLQGETAPQTFCRLLRRMQTDAPVRKQVAAVGEVLRAALPADCAARLGQFS